MNNQFTQRMSDIIMYSREEAIRFHNVGIGPEHLLLGILREGEGKAIDVLESLHVDLDSVKKKMEEELRNEATYMTPPGEMTFNGQASRIIQLSVLEARLLRSPAIDSEHLLLAIMRDGQNAAAELLGESDVSYRSIHDKLARTLEPMDGFDFDEDDEEESQGNAYHNPNAVPFGSQTTAGEAKVKETPMLDNFSTDMTAAAAEGKLDPIVGREKEIERVAQILSRRKKNNPILIGEPGVGKSAVVEGLALRIARKEVPRALFGKRVFALDMMSIVAGTKYRGQFEERIRVLLKELKENPDIILFIDEIHTIVGAGAASGSMDAANMLKPALSRGGVQCIGATTLDEYRENIEKDGALERRFQKVLIEPATPEETLQILHNIKGKYEEHHNVSYTDNALIACVKLTGRYITDRNFPDKAIDALDEAGSRVHLTQVEVPRELEEQEKEVEKIRTLKNEAVTAQNFELAAEFRDREKQAADHLAAMTKEWEARQKEARQTVDDEEVAQVVSMMSGVPVQRLAESESIRLKNMMPNLKQRIIGQDKAVETVVKAIRRSRMGLKDPKHPIGTFLFVGPTGVGKTQLTKALAKEMFGSEDDMIRIDMSEYMERFTVSRLIGAAPGYVGYEEGGQLTERVRRKPYSIILLDELEKANPEVFNLLLQVLDEGRLTDGSGRTVDFRNTVIIMTSNIGTRQLKDFGKGVGFTAPARDDKASSREIIMKALSKSFAPEFVNRIDEIVMFDPLDVESIERIIDIELERLYKRMEELGYRLVIDPEAKKWVATKGYDVQYGARPLKRAIQSYVEDGLSELLLNEAPQSGDTLHVSLDETGKALHMQVEKA